MQVDLNSSRWSPQWQAYARWHRKTPEEMMQQHDAEWNGSMSRFIVWIGERLREYGSEDRRRVLNGHAADISDWCKWLANLPLPASIKTSHD